MKKEPILYSIIGLLAGLLIMGASVVLAVNNDNHRMMRMMGMDPDSHHKTAISDHSQMSMTEMNEQLKRLSGDEFDKTFIEMMIVHHQGAIDMANLALDNAKHEEIKNLSREIISAQTKEIEQLLRWQSEWGYSGMPASHDMSDM